MENREELEILSILQEECAEVIQAASKIKRFGLTGRYPDDKSPTNLQHLELELGDLMALVEILAQKNIINLENIEHHAKNKREKLRVWSTINFD